MVLELIWMTYLLDIKMLTNFDHVVQSFSNTLLVIDVRTAEMIVPTLSGL